MSFPIEMWSNIFKLSALVISEIPRKFQKRLFCDGEVGGGSGDVNAICSRPEVDNDAISREDVATFRDYNGVSLWFISFSSFP